MKRRWRSRAGWTIAAVLFFSAQGKLIRFKMASEHQTAQVPEAHKPIFCPVDHLEFLEFIDQMPDPSCDAFEKSINPVEWEKMKRRLEKKKSQK